MAVPWWKLARGVVTAVQVGAGERRETAQNGPAHAFFVHARTTAWTEGGIAHTEEGIVVAAQQVSPARGQITGWKPGSQYVMDRGREPVRFLVCAFNANFSSFWGGDEHTMDVVVPERRLGYRPAAFSFVLDAAGTPVAALPAGHAVKRVGAFLVGDGTDLDRIGFYTERAGHDSKGRLLNLAHSDFFPRESPVPR